MAYRLPNFNLEVGIWHPPIAVPPPVGPAAIETVGNLSPGRRVSMLAVASAMEMWLLLPPLTDIRRLGYVQVPLGSGRWYQVQVVDDIGKGFANEHRFAIILQDNANWPVPDNWVP